MACSPRLAALTDVAIVPGATVLTVMPRFASSKDNDLVAECKATLAAA